MCKGHLRAELAERVVWVSEEHILSAYLLPELEPESVLELELELGRFFELELGLELERSFELELGLGHFSGLELELEPEPEVEPEPEFEPENILVAVLLVQRHC